MDFQLSKIQEAYAKQCNCGEECGHSGASKTKGRTKLYEKTSGIPSTIRVSVEDTPYNILTKKCWNCENLIDAIDKHDLEDDFNALICDEFAYADEESVDLTSLNDYFRFQWDEILEKLGIDPNEDENDEAVQKCNEGLGQIVGGIVGSAVGGTLAGNAGADLGGRIMSGAASTVGNMVGSAAGGMLDNANGGDEERGV